MTKHAFIESAAVVAAIGASAGTAAGLVRLTQGQRSGAPGVTSALSRMGRRVGGGMITGVALAAGSGALAGMVLYQGLKALERRYI